MRLTRVFIDGPLIQGSVVDLPRDTGAHLAKVLRVRGGDEFILLFEGDSLGAGSEVIAERIREVLLVPFEIPASSVPLAVSASIGIAVGETATPDELLRNADIALYRAKAEGPIDGYTHDILHTGHELRNRQIHSTTLAVLNPTIAARMTANVAMNSDSVADGTGAA